MRKEIAMLLEAKATIVPVGTKVRNTFTGSIGFLRDEFNKTMNPEYVKVKMRDISGRWQYKYWILKNVAYVGE